MFLAKTSQEFRRLTKLGFIIRIWKGRNYVSQERLWGGGVRLGREERGCTGRMGRMEREKEKEGRKWEGGLGLGLGVDWCGWRQ